jgi:hypothetical protein
MHAGIDDRNLRCSMGVGAWNLGLMQVRPRRWGFCDGMVDGDTGSQANCIDRMTIRVENG